MGGTIRGRKLIHDDQEAEVKTFPASQRARCERQERGQYKGFFGVDTRQQTDQKERLSSPDISPVVSSQSLNACPVIERQGLSFCGCG